MAELTIRPEEIRDALDRFVSNFSPETASRDEVAEQAAQYVTYGWAIGARDYIKWDERTGDTPDQERQQAAADASARRSRCWARWTR